MTTPDPFDALTSPGRRRAAARLDGARRFAGEDANRCPALIRSPHSLPAWRALAPEAREAHLKLWVVLSLPATAFRGAPEQEAPSPEPEPPPPPAAAPVSAPAASFGARYRVPCAGDCGRYLDARGPRPALLYCSPPRPARSPQRPSVSAGPDAGIQRRRARRGRLTPTCEPLHRDAA
jgi:hypothetical protein